MAGLRRVGRRRTTRGGDAFVCCKGGWKHGNMGRILCLWRHVWRRMGSSWRHIPADCVHVKGGRVEGGGWTLCYGWVQVRGPNVRGSLNCGTLVSLYSWRRLFGDSKCLWGLWIRFSLVRALTSTAFCFINRLTPNDPYRGRTAPLTSRLCILYIYSTNISTEYFKHALYSPFFSLFKMQFVP